MQLELTHGRVRFERVNIKLIYERRARQRPYWLLGQRYMITLDFKVNACVMVNTALK